MEVNKLTLYVPKGAVREDLLKQIKHEHGIACKIENENKRMHLSHALFNLYMKLEGDGICFEKGNAFFADGWNILTYPYYGKEKLFWVDDEFYLVPLFIDMENEIGRKGFSISEHKKKVRIENFCNKTDTAIKDWIKEALED